MIQGFRPLRPRSRRFQSGQALVEYAFVLIAILGIYSIINRSVLRGIGGVWMNIGKTVAPGCPKCEPPEEIR